MFVFHLPKFNKLYGKKLIPKALNCLHIAGFYEDRTGNTGLSYISSGDCQFNLEPLMMKLNAFLLLALLLLGALSCNNPGKSESNPNIIFILVDDMGWTDLGCYGSTFYETPNIDQLAGRSMRFTSAYAACPVCSPTRASIMTGKYPARTGVTDWITGRQSYSAGLPSDMLLSREFEFEVRKVKDHLLWVTCLHQLRGGELHGEESAIVFKLYLDVQREMGGYVMDWMKQPKKGGK